MKIENKNVRRNFFWGEGRFYTTDIVNKRAGVMIKNVSKEEFTITLRMVLNFPPLIFQQSLGKRRYANSGFFCLSFHSFTFNL